MKRAINEIRREEIIAATIRCLARASVGATTLETVAREMRGSKGGVTYYYKNKDDLIIDTFRAFTTEMIWKKKEEVARLNDPVKALYSYLGFVTLSQLNVYHHLLIEMNALSLHNKSAKIALQEFADGFLRITGGVLREGVAQGLFEVEDVDMLAKALGGVLQGVANRWFLLPETHPPEDAKKSLELILESILGIKNPFLVN